MDEPSADRTPPATCELLFERNEEPSTESPLHYRERTFFVPPGTSVADAERLMHERFDALRQELAGQPEAKFFNLAVFDHRWKGRPDRPPLVTLQWKDWRGEPQIAHPRKEQAARVATHAPRPLPAEAASAHAPAPISTTVPRPQPAKPPLPGGGGQAPAPRPAQSTAAKPSTRSRSSTDEHDARLAQAFEATQDLFFLATPAEGLDFAVRLLDELIPSEAATACLYDINTDELRWVALSGTGAELQRGRAFPARKGLSGAASERIGVPHHVDDLSGEPDFDPSVDGREGLHPRNALYFSLHHQGQLLGILQLLNRKNAAHFSKADGELIAYIGHRLSEFLFQARLKASTSLRP